MADDERFDIPAELRSIRESLHSLHRKLDTMSTALSDLQAAVAAQTTVDASVVTLLQGLSAQLTAALAAGDDTAVEAAAQAIAANTATLAAAVTANTPAAPSSPAPSTDASAKKA
jgi:peptidoglycan hydrolase CwlO-like protein